MMLSITPLYAAPIAVLFMYLSILVIRFRRSHLVAFGDQGDNNLLRLMRAQGNCAEYAPLGLILLIMAELSGAAAWGVHLAGALFVVGRVVHGIGLAHYPRIIACRVAGITATFSSYLVALVLALV